MVPMATFDDDLRLAHVLADAVERFTLESFRSEDLEVRFKDDGTLAYKGGIDSIPSAKVEDIAKADPYVKEALADVAAGRKVEKASTRPYGCSVKYAS